MRLRAWLLSTLVAATMMVGIDRAQADDQIEIKVNSNNMVEIATVEVAGKYEDGRYSGVPKLPLRYVVAVRGAWGYGGSGRPQFWLWVTPWMWSHPIHESLFEDWEKYVVTREYRDPMFAGAANQDISPIDLCNDKLEQVHGSARESFMKQGYTFVYPQAYEIAANVYVSNDNVDDPATENYVSIKVPARIVCKPLTAAPAAPAATRDPTPPLFSKVTLRVEPAQIVKMGKFLCPSKITLHGSVEATREFHGKTLFVGPHYLSNITAINFQAAGSHNVAGTYTMNWQQIGGLTTAPNSEPKRQRLTFHFNIADNGGELWGSAEKTIEVSCRKIKVNAPTAGDGMTVNPAN